MPRITNLLIQGLRDRNMTIALAESVTCGLASQRLGAVKGVAEVLKGSIICYDPEVKIRLLNISRSLIRNYTAESQQVTDALVKKLPGLIDADIYAAITGLACAGGSETAAKPVGTIFISVSVYGKLYRLRKVFRGTPGDVRRKAVEELCRFTIRCLKLSSTH